MSKLSFQERAAAIATIGQRAVAGEPLESISRLAMQVVSAALGFPCLVALVSKDRKTFDFIAGAGGADDLVGSSLLQEECPVASEALDSFDLVRREIASDPVMGRKPASVMSIRIAPVDDPRGVICVHAPAGHRWPPEDVAFVQSVASVLTETAARRQFDDDLQASERKYRSLADLLPDAMIVHQEGKIVYANNSAARLFHANDPGELLKRPMIELVHTADRPRVLERIERIANGETVPFIEERHIGLDGAVVETEVAASAGSWNGRPAVQAVIRDVSERRKAERALRASQERFEIVTRITSEAVRDLDLLTNQVSWNVGMLANFGYAPEQVGEGLEWWTSKVHPADRKRVLESFHSTVRGRISAWTEEYRFQKADGEWAYVLDRAEILRDDSGAPIRVIGAMLDLSERWRHVQQLRSAEERFRAFMDNSPAIAWIKNREGRYVYASEPFLKLFGKNAEEIIGKTDHDWLDAETADQFHENDLKVLDSGAAIETIERRKSLVIKFPLNLDGTQHVGGMALDMSEREKAREELASKQQFLQALIDNIDDAIAACDANGNLILANRAIRAVFSKFETLTSDVQMLGDKFEIYSSDGSTRLDSKQNPLFRAWKGEFVSDEEVVIMTGGVPHIFQVHGQPVIGPGGTNLGAVIVARDVTESRRIREQIEESNRLLSLGKLAASVAHEFNNVLMAIQPFAEVIRRHASPDAPHIERAVEAIQSAVRRGKRVTQEVLRFGRPAEPVLEAISIEQWLADLEPELRSHLGDRIRLRVSIDGDDLQIKGDLSQLQQVLVNLALNARDAMPEGGELSLCAEQGLSATSLRSYGMIPSVDRYVHLSVKDNGCGMTQEVRRHAFEPLFSTKKSGGTGLGLPIARQIILQHGGMMFLESVPGEGTEVHLFLPAHAHDEAEISDPRPPAEMRPLRVLLVEDDELIADGIRDVLEAAGHSVENVTRAHRVLKSVREFSPDAVVLDVRLPDGDGRQVFHSLSELFPTLPVVFSTGHADELQNLAELSPRVRFLLKPYAGETLIRALAEVTSANAVTED